MAAKSIHEAQGKQMISKWLGEYAEGGLDTLDLRCVLVRRKEETRQSFFEQLASDNAWLTMVPLVVKPDQLIKRRGKLGLISINKSYEEVQTWINQKSGHEIQVEKLSGFLDTFIIEPFVPHSQEQEYYVCIHSLRDCDEILFHHEGGVDVGDVDTKAVKYRIPLGESLTMELVIEKLLQHVPATQKSRLAKFVCALFAFFRDLHYVYLEINPLVVLEDKIAVLDLAAKIDETADFLCGSKWGQIDFPAPFGRAAFPEEAYIADLDSKTGASLKLTILNHSGMIWTMIAGGGASVVYADAIADLGFGKEMANYGEYSGAPNENQTFNYAKTILDLMTRVYDPRGKILIIGGGIANFTDVASTFKGIVSALRMYQEDLRKHNVRIWVRRGGPNYQQGLVTLRQCGNEIKVPMHIYGPETHIVKIVPLALKLVNLADYPEFDSEANKEFTMQRSNSMSSLPETTHAEDAKERASAGCVGKGKTSVASNASNHLVVTSTNTTQCFVYGLQNRAVQGMLDFDFMCNRKDPSVAAMIYPFTPNHYIKFYWGTSEIMLPCYKSLQEAVEKHTRASVYVNFASFRSVYSTVIEALKFNEQLKTIAIIAEGVPEAQTRKLIKLATEKGVGIIGPATVGGIKPGCFRIGNTGGMIDNIIMSKLYRPGSVAYVSKSGGMSNELNNMICRNADGVYEGVAIGGDRYPGTLFVDHLLRYQDNPDVKFMVLLGEVGGIDEYTVCELMRSGRLNKPIVAWCIGTCATLFAFELQFGHAGACARGANETAAAKNKALAEAGCIVPKTFADIGEKISEVYQMLLNKGTISPFTEPPVPNVPMDFNWAKRLGLVRKPANFISSISDERGEELIYGGMPISEVFNENIGVGGVLSLLWFKKHLPSYASKFIEIILMVTADHGPAVSGAHNTIVTARAGKDLVSSLTSGLLTIGPRFGGALDEAAAIFTEACDSGVSPKDFVRNMKRDGKLIMGIGHRVKSIDNPDMRVVIIKDYAQKHFSSNRVLQYALEVEKVTTKKKGNLILNVDGCIAVCFVDMLRSCGAFTKVEANDLVAMGALNGLFVLGRSIGFIGHFLDQNRLRQPLYRHPWDDISYVGNSV